MKVSDMISVVSGLFTLYDNVKGVQSTTLAVILVVILGMVVYKQEIQNKQI